MAKSAVTKRPVKPAPSEFGGRLAKTRLERGLTRDQLAQRANVTNSLLCRLETTPRNSTEAETIFRLAGALRVRPEWLWRGVPPKNVDSAEQEVADLRAALEKVHDEPLAAAIKKAKRHYHPGVLAVAAVFARDGERHTVEGWIARLDEIADTMSPLIPT